MILRLNAIIVIISCGTQVVLLCEEMDFSQGAIAAFAGCAAIMLEGRGWNLPMAVTGALMIGVAFGILNGVVVTKCHIPSFIMTLATQKIARGIILGYRNGHPAYDIGKIAWMGQGHVAYVIPTQVFFMILILGLTWFLLNRTSLGRQFYAVGDNTRAALASGIRADRIRIIAFIYAGVMSALGGIILMGRIGSGQPSGAEGYEFEAVTAVIIGGTSLSGGEGNIYGTFAGAIFVGVLNNFMTITRVSSYWQQVVQGVMIAIVVIIDARIHEKKIKR